MADVVNLDALIERNDFLAIDGAEVGQDSKNLISKTDLLRGESFYLTLRKPDFQRETAAWSPDQVADFIEAFIDGDLIPAVVCWQSPSRLSFIIDGAHRLSCLIAWLSNDYGDGEHSIKFYSNNIPEEQRRVAKKTRELVDKRIGGSYQDFQAETANPGSNPKISTKARALAHSNIPLLWIRKQESRKAEVAFLKINRSGVQIDATELQILQNRFTPAAVAARAIVRNATGFKYWKGFSVAGKQELETSAKHLYQALYTPPLQSGVKTTELPIAGHGYGSQTLPLVYHLVNIANGFKVVDASKVDAKIKRKPSDALPQEADEAQTLAVVRQTQHLGRLITGTHPSSLGLHPAIYFYAADGNHQPTAVMAVAAMVKALEDEGKLIAFCDVRVKYEAFLKQHKMFINQLTTMHGSMAKGYRLIRDYLRFVLDQFIEGHSEDKVSELLQAHDKYSRLVKTKPISSRQAKGFSQDLKQWKCLQDAMDRALECRWCHASVDHKSMHLDHVEDKKLGGAASSDNAAWAHPYCDSTYKDWLRSEGRLT